MCEKGTLRKHQENRIKIHKKKRTIYLSWWQVPLFSSVTSRKWVFLEVLKNYFLLSATIFYTMTCGQLLALGLPHCSGHSNSLSCCAESSPCRVLQRSAWPLTPPSQGWWRRSHISLGQTLATTLLSFSMSWATVVQLSPFLKELAPGVAGIGSVGSCGEMKVPLRKQHKLQQKPLPPRRYCLGVTWVKPTSSWLSSCHCLWQTTSNSSGCIH